MTQRELNRAVAAATGESPAMIAKLGFVPLTLGPVECEPRGIDWDDFDQRRHAAVAQQRSRAAVV